MDGLCLNTGIHGMMASKIFGPGALEVRPSTIPVSAVGRSADKLAAVSPPQKLSSSSRFSFRSPFKTLWPGGRNGSGEEKARDDNAINNAVSEENSEEMSSQEGRNENCVLKILRVNSLWSENKEKSTDEEPEDEEKNGDKNSCDVCRVGDGNNEGRIEFDRDSFSKMLNRVSLADAKLYAQMSYLGNLAYSIPNIKPGKLLKYRGLRFVTSSFKKRELAMEAEKSLASEKKEAERNTRNGVQDTERRGIGRMISPSAAYGIAASAAAYLYSQTKSIVPFQSSADECEGSNGDDNLLDAHVASLMATSDSMTAVVAAKEEVKQAVADDLSSSLSSPCEWFICDDDRSATRYVIIQGSESLASWQANLLFEPIQFEGLDVLVHRGIYEAAKGIYSQLLPEVRAHLKSHGRRATFRFTGHSLGGSLSLLINLMLLIRREVPASALLPVIGFGSPYIMCGGDHLLKQLGLPRNFVQTITIHRDIVPRVFSCDYPSRVAQLLKAVNRNFRSHPCLINQKLLYAPMGELLILQPDEKFSPQHHLLPSGNGLYSLSRSLPNAGDVEKQLQVAQSVFLNSPHPLEILSDRAAYGIGGTIQRDHDVKAYLSCVRYVIRQELKREKRRKLWWSVVLTYNACAGIILGSVVVIIYRDRAQVYFSGILRAGGETITRFGRHVASQYTHWIVVLLFLVRFLLARVYSMISFPLGR